MKQFILLLLVISLSSCQSDDEINQNFLNKVQKDLSNLNTLNDSIQVYNKFKDLIDNKKYKNKTPYKEILYPETIETINTALNSLLNRQKLLLDDKDWNNAKIENSIDSYTFYIEKHPRGKHLSEAKKEINGINEDIFWNRTLDINTKEAYSEYLGKYPNGKYADKARKSLANFEDTSIPTPGENTQISHVVSKIIFKTIKCIKQDDSDFDYNGDEIKLVVNNNEVLYKTNIKNGDILDLSNLPTLDITPNSVISISLIEIDQRTKNDVLLEFNILGNNFKKGIYRKNGKSSYLIGKYELIYELK